MARPDPNDLFQAYRFDDWHEDLGDVLWWRLPVQEPPYVGGPHCLGYVVEVEVNARASSGAFAGGTHRMNVGGWPFEESDYPNLVWTLLPGAIRMPK